MMLGPETLSVMMDGENVRVTHETIFGEYVEFPSGLLRDGEGRGPIACYRFIRNILKYLLCLA